MSNVLSIEKTLPAATYEQAVADVHNWTQPRKGDAYVAHLLRAFRLRPAGMNAFQHDVGLQLGHFVRFMQRYNVPESAWMIPTT